MSHNKAALNLQCPLEPRFRQEPSPSANPLLLSPIALARRGWQVSEFLASVAARGSRGVAEPLPKAPESVATSPPTHSAAEGYR